MASDEWVTLVRSELHANVAGDRGGAVRASRVTVVDSTVHGNIAAGDGGGLATDLGPLEGEDLGGPLARTDGNRISNATVSGNRAGGAGGGIAMAGDLALQNATVHDNHAEGGGDAVAGAGTLTTTASVLSSAPGRDSCTVATTASLGGNLDTSASCGLDGGADRSGLPARLGALRHNGGPTSTHLPLAGSPLVDAFAALPTSVRGTYPSAPPCSPTGRAADQRSTQALVARQEAAGRENRFTWADPRHGGSGSGCDIGAVEAVHPPHRYRDVPPWAGPAVRWSSLATPDRPVIMGPVQGGFAPDRPVTRAEAAVALHAFAGRPVVERRGRPLDDVAPWAEEAITWISHDPPGPERALMAGYPDGSFHSGRALTRAQFARLAHRFTGGLPVPVELGTDDVPEWARADVAWLLSDPDGDGPLAPVMTGFPDGSFRPGALLSRGAFVQALHRLALTPEAWDDGAGAPLDPSALDDPEADLLPGAVFAPAP